MFFVKLIVRATLLSALANLPASADDGSPAPKADGAQIAAAWKQQRIDFSYFGRTARYSCDGLSDKVRMLLLRVGVRPDLRMQTYGCEINGISLTGVSPGLNIQFFAPFPRAPGETDASAARGAGTQPAPVQARYEPFVFERDSFRDLDVGDCELIEEFVRQILPRLATRSVTRSITCVPYENTPGSYRVRGEVLKALPAPGGR